MSHLVVLCACQAHQGPSAACGGALRAALTRARAAAWGQLCNEGHVLRCGQRKESYCDVFSPLDRGVQIRLLDSAARGITFAKIESDNN